MERIKRVGLPPGSLIYVGKKFTEPVTFEIIAYNEEFLEEATLESTDDIKQFLNKNYKIWLNVNGLHDAKVVEEIGTLFNIHPLTQEDIMNTEQRPKAEEYDDYLFIALKMLNKHPSRDTFESEHLSLICGNNYVISFQEEKGDNFDVVRERLRKGHRIRKRGVDYLTYVLMDVTIDSYFLVTEKMGEWISHEEIKIIKDPNVKRTFEINQLRHDMSQFRKHIWPVRDVINSIIRYQGDLISSETQLYFRDVYDHVVQIIDTVETERDMVANLMDLYLSNISFKMNEVMKTLTIISTIFIPITFITSLYGMNFRHLPELEWHYGYYAVLAIIIATTIGMLYYFKRQKWF